MGRCTIVIRGSTGSREVKLNGGRDRYRALNADRDAWRRARRPKLATHAVLRAVVEDKLELRWSPQQIAGWLSQTHPDCEAMRISHETINLSLCVQSRGALGRELTAQLRRGHTTRRPHGCPLPQGRGQLKDKLMISERVGAMFASLCPIAWLRRNADCWQNCAWPCGTGTPLRFASCQHSCRRESDEVRHITVSSSRARLVGWLVRGSSRAERLGRSESGAHHF